MTFSFGTNKWFIQYTPCKNEEDQGDGSNDHLIDTRPAFLSALSWHIIRHWLSSAKITIPFHFTKAFAEK